MCVFVNISVVHKPIRYSYILSRRSSASREDCKEALEVDLVGRVTSEGAFLVPTFSTGLEITGGFAGSFLTSLLRRLLTGGELTSLELPPRRLDIVASTDSSSTTAYNNESLLLMFQTLTYYT